MKKTVTLIAAPTAPQPGGYILKAYADRTMPNIHQADLSVEPVDKGWKITLGWDCPAPVKSIAKETDKFIDACALLVPVTPDAPWISMGAPGKAVDGILWKADRERPWYMRAEGLGTMQRNVAPADWKVTGAWDNGRWLITFELPEWPLLSQQKQIAFGIWHGADQDRAGLKSISPGWIPVE